MCLFVNQSLIIRAFIVLIFSLHFSLIAHADGHPPQAEKGVLDLRNWDFDGNNPLELSGEWEFYWQEFLDPTQVNQTQQLAKYTQVPGVWLGRVVDGEPLGKYGYATYRLKILLPKKPQDVALYLKRFQSAYRLYVNGQLWMQSGTPGKTAATEKATVIRKVGHLKRAKETIDIVIHASNHVGYSGGGFFNSFTLGAEKDQSFNHLAELSRDTFLSGALVCLGVFLMILHLGRFREKTYFVLYVMSFWSAAYMLTVESTLVELFPSISWFWNERLSYISATFLIALTYEFIHQINPRKTSAILSHVILYQATIISLFTIFWPGGFPVEITFMIALHLIIVSASCLVEVRYVLINKITGAWLIIMGVSTLVLFGAHDILHANGFFQSVFLGPYGILVLLLFYAAILALRVNTSITLNEQFAQAIRSMNDGVAIFDNRDQVVVWNMAYQNHLSSKAQEILRPGQLFNALVQADATSGELPDASGREQDYIHERMQRHQHPGDAFELERNGLWYLYREAKTPDGGRVTLAANLSHQKTKEVELQRALAELIKANDAKNSFLSNMSHELRTPLNAINGFSEMMEKGVLGPLNTQYQDYAHHISRSGKHLLRLVTDMLDVARIESGKLQITPEEVDLPSLLEECFQMEERKFTERKLNFTKTVPDKTPLLYADPVRVSQILLNLLDNAIKFTADGGHISVTTDITANGIITLKISDTGIGMAEKDIEKALQKFGQIRQSHLNSHDGLGLGLSIANTLMELHGGTLTLQSQLGKGTLVTISFPPFAQSKAFFESQVA